MGVEMNSSGATVTWILLVTMYVIYEKTGTNVTMCNF